MTSIKTFLTKTVVDEYTGCWNWTASRRKDGYGHAWHDGKLHLAHRLSYELHNGKIPNGEGHHGTCVLHKCDNRACVNPDHLFLGTQAENVADRDNKNRQCSKITKEDVLAIRASRGVTQDELAERFGVSQTQIYKILHRIKWKNVPAVTNRVPETKDDAEVA